MAEPKILLSDALSDNITAEEAIRILEEMRKREKILKEWPNAIQHTSRGYYRTKIKTEGSTKEFSAKTREGLADKLAAYLEEQKNTVTFIVLYKTYRKTTDVFRSPTTNTRKDYLFKAYFSGSDAMLTKPVDKITTADVTAFLAALRGTHSLTTIDMDNIIATIRSVFRYGIAAGMMQNDPSVSIPTREIKRGLPQRKSTDARIFSEEETTKLHAEFLKKIEKKPYEWAAYACLCLMYTGARVGEIGTLKWENVREDTIEITSSETSYYDGEKYVKEVGQTKTRKTRTIPLTTPLRDLFVTIKARQENMGIKSSFVFPGKNTEWLTVAAINWAFRMACKKIGIKGNPHKMRRTVSSRLNDAGAGTAFVSAVLGHTENINKKAYTYDSTDMERKKSIMAGVFSGYTGG